MRFLTGAGSKSQLVGSRFEVLIGTLGPRFGTDLHLDEVEAALPWIPVLVLAFTNSSASLFCSIRFIWCEW